ncbi:MAG: chemotaxis protein CheD [Dehalococcoidia bacterium]
MVATTTERALGLGEWAVSAAPGSVLTCLGLGSCVALVAYDASAKVGGMAHMVLPDSVAGRVSETSPAKFVDLAVPLLLAEMERAGAQRTRMQVQLVGGASMLEVPGRTNTMQIGERNAAAARKALAAERLPVKQEHLGGTRGRTVRLDVGTGRIEVSTAGPKE